jgi:hypothetical protein
MKTAVAGDDFDPRRLVAILIGALLTLSGVFGW